MKVSSGRIFHTNVAVAEEVRVAGDELPDRFHQIDRCRSPFVHLAFDPGEIQDAVDVSGETLRVLKHEPDIFELFLTGECVLRECLEIELQ